MLFFEAEQGLTVMKLNCLSSIRTAISLLLVLGLVPLHSAIGERASSTDRIEETPSDETSTIVGATDYSRALQPWKGDYDGMLDRRMLRIAVPYSMTHYFLDGASERGVAAAMGRQLEQEINQQESLRTRRLHVVFIPVSRKLLLDYVVDGLADIAMGGITVTDRRRDKVAFTMPFIRDSEELLVTGPGTPEIESLADLAGQTLYAQRRGSYYASLQKLNQSLQQQELPPIRVEPIDELLEPDEILELVQAGQIPLTVTDRHLARISHHAA